MFFPIDLHVCFGQRVDRLSVLPRIEDQISIARPDNAPLVEIAEIVIDLLRIRTIGAVSGGETNQSFVVAIDRILPGVRDRPPPHRAVSNPSRSHRTPPSSGSFDPDPAPSNPV